MSLKNGRFPFGGPIRKHLGVCGPPFLEITMLVALCHQKNAPQHAFFLRFSLHFSKYIYIHVYLDISIYVYIYI